MFDLITIGNISVDLYFQGESLTFHNGRFQLAVGGKYFADRVRESIGGGAANVAIGTSRHGLKSAVFCPIGINPFRPLILDTLRKENVSYTLCRQELDYVNISSILLTPKGERTIIHYTSPQTKLLHSKDEKQKLLQTKAIYLGNLSGISLEERLKLLNFFKKNQILVIVNLGVKDCRRPKSELSKIFAVADILLVNGHEFSDLVKADYRDISFNHETIKWYIPQLWEKIIVVTEGAKGSYCWFEDYYHHEPAEKVARVIDTTGAGDAYTAGFISGFITQRDIRKAMEIGTKYSASILKVIGAN